MTEADDVIRARPVDTGEPEPLSPRPIRWLVFAALVGVAILAIWIIDGHVMKRATTFEQLHQIER